MPAVLIDAGPLTAMLNPREEHHMWALASLRRLEKPLLTSEAVLAETAHLIARHGGDPDGLFDLRASGIIAVGIRFDEEWESLRGLMARYRNLPMSLAGATLVRLSELHRDCRVFTLDTDFRIYRRHRSRVIPVLMPETSDPKCAGSLGPVVFSQRIEAPEKGATRRSHLAVSRKFPVLSAKDVGGSRGKMVSRSRARRRSSGGAGCILRVHDGGR